jgi:hypothetical protein
MDVSPHLWYSREDYGNADLIRISQDTYEGSIMEDRTLRQVIREEWKKLSGLTWGQRIRYIIDYYKIEMGAIVLLICLINVGLTIYHNKQLVDVVQVYFLNCNFTEMDTDAMKEEFADYIGGIGEKDVITIDTSMTLGQDEDTEYSYAAVIKMQALLTAGSVDLLIMDEDMYRQYQEAGYFRELSEVLTTEQQERWADLLVYDDVPVIDEKTGEIVYETEGTDEGAQDAAGTEREQGIYGINVQDSPVLQQQNAYQGQPAYAAIVDNTKHLENCGRFLEYLLD